MLEKMSSVQPLPRTPGSFVFERSLGSALNRTRGNITPDTVAWPALALGPPAITAVISCPIVKAASGTLGLPKTFSAQAVESRELKPTVVEQMKEKICWLAWWNLRELFAVCDSARLLPGAPAMRLVGPGRRQAAPVPRRHAPFSKVMRGRPDTGSTLRL